MIADEVEPDILQHVRKLGRQTSRRLRLASAPGSKIEDWNLLNRPGANRRQRGCGGFHGAPWWLCSIRWSAALSDCVKPQADGPQSEGRTRWLGTEEQLSDFRIGCELTGSAGST